MRCTAVVLAAGEGTRMKSSTPKVIHPILGRPMAGYALDAAQSVSDWPPILVVGYQAEEVKTALDAEARYVIQDEQLGTGHALQQAESLVEEASDLVLVTNADMPLIRPETLSEIIEAQSSHEGPMTLLTLKAEDPRGFGRVIRGEGGSVTAIVEEADASEEELAVRECNAGMYCFRAQWLWKALPKIDLSPKGEYYLTDLVEIAVQEGQSVQAVVASDTKELIGINNRVHLAEAVKILQRRINRQWMLAGVTIIDPETTYIESTVRIGQDTVIKPNTYLEGETVIGRNGLIGPNTTLKDVQVGDDCQIESSTVEEAVVEDEVDIGPYSHLRKGAHLGRGVHIGNYCEVKEAYLGEGTKMGHFSYIGNAEVGEGVNIGAGTITCNYDGTKKHLTKIGDHVFLGSDTMLVAPVEVGEGARTGAGSVVTKDITPYTLAVGVPARVVRQLRNMET
ncbi:MAG: bifunctional UDP-N-acetylglucosamine diphosphorylase/glucosamine-1-phosphate N-acetyltransferase GlmU [Anaerolineales bacterium]